MASTLIKASTDEVLAERVMLARTPWERARGLVGAPALEPGAALIITPAKQVHSFAIAGPIDVVFCSGSWTVLHVVSPLSRNRITKWVRSARCAIELSAGVASGLHVGDQLSVVSDSVR